jgi:hypothetical protein
MSSERSKIPRRLWMVMKMQPWDSVGICTPADRRPLCWKIDGPQDSPGYIPVFESEDAARKFGGVDAVLLPIEVMEKQP